MWDTKLTSSGEARDSFRQLAMHRTTLCYEELSSPKCQL